MNRKTFLLLIIIMGLSLILLSDCSLFEDEPLGTCTVSCVCPQYGYNDHYIYDNYTEYEWDNLAMIGPGVQYGCKINWVENNE
jgi:hypothetical protein